MMIITFVVVEYEDICSDFQDFHDEDEDFVYDD